MNMTLQPTIPYFAIVTGFCYDFWHLLSFLAFAVAAWMIWKAPEFRSSERLGAGLIAGGAIGNAVDRIRFGKVVDFIDVYVQTWHWPAFNIADAGITVGAVIWIASLFLERETEST